MIWLWIILGVAGLIGGWFLLNVALTLLACY